MQTATDIATIGVHSSLPDWSAITARIACPLCDYELRGLTDPRCPECGGRFEWTLLLDPTNQKHPFLFEHHPEHNLSSFARTKLAGFTPWKFWKALKPAQQSRPSRLILYFLLSTLMALAVALDDFATSISAQMDSLRQQRASMIAAWSKDPTTVRLIIGRSGSVENLVNTVLPPVWSSRAFSSYTRKYGDMQNTQAKLFLVAVYIAWPWMTFAALMVFQISMRRAKVRPIHVLRCAIYSGDFSLIVAGLVYLLIPKNVHGYLGPFNGTRLMVFPTLQLVIAVAAAAMGLATLYKLYFAYRSYLPFSHPLATTVASQFVVVLAVISLSAATLMALGI